GNTSIELFETRTPVLLLEKNYLSDTGGPGRHRGGLGQLVRVRKLYDDGRPVLAGLHPDGVLTRTAGRLGGRAGGPVRGGARRLGGRWGWTGARRPPRSGGRGGPGSRHRRPRAPDPPRRDLGGAARRRIGLRPPLRAIRRGGAARPGWQLRQSHRRRAGLRLR